jgi:hypothetical protein
VIDQEIKLKVINGKSQMSTDKRSSGNRLETDW